MKLTSTGFGDGQPIPAEKTIQHAMTTTESFKKQQLRLRPGLMEGFPELFPQFPTNFTASGQVCGKLLLEDPGSCRKTKRIIYWTLV